jgi:hypothetical protein
MKSNDPIREAIVSLRDSEERKECGCYICSDSDGERIRVHCTEHCPRVIAGDWDECRGC